MYRATAEFSPSWPTTFQRASMSANFSSPIPGRIAPKGRERNLPGDKYHRLVLVEEAPEQTVQASWRRWLCKCDCGTTRFVLLNHLRGGRSRSCGCLLTEILSNRRTHGMDGTRTHTIWTNIIQRCTNPNYKHWGNYGGRGISLCPEWNNSFEAFLKDMGECPEGLSIDRIDNNLGYSPSNCRWATTTQQARNQRSNRLVSYRGHNICLAEAVEVAGLPYDRVHARLNQLGWPISRALESSDFSDPI